jgi:hypothetical protein
MSIRAFAEHLGVGTNTAAGWEDRRAPASPNTVTQSILDQALKLADPDARARFRMILQHRVFDADVVDAADTARTPDARAGSTVALLRTATTSLGGQRRSADPQTRGRGDTAHETVECDIRAKIETWHDDPHLRGRLL